MRKVELGKGVERALGVLEAAGLSPFVAGGVFHPPAGDVDVYVPEWPGRGEIREVARALEASRVRDKGLCLEFRAEPLPVQIVPVPFRDPEEVLNSFDLGAAQIGLWRGELVETEAHREAVREWRPLVLGVGPATPVLKYREKGFLDWEEDFVDALFSLAVALAGMSDAERSEFLWTYDGLALRAGDWAEGLGPGLVCGLLGGGRRVRLVPARVFRGAPRA